MLKAVFIDYSGTTVQEGGDLLQELLIRIMNNSSFKDPNEFKKVWWTTIRTLEKEHVFETYLPETELVEEALHFLEREYGLKEDIPELVRLIDKAWAYAPVFEDTKQFYDGCPYPIYVITNNSETCVQEAMRVNDLSPAGIISADEVKACKPCREIFELALSKAGCSSDQVVHIGDSLKSDYLGAQNAGIRAILLDRNGKNMDTEVLKATDLNECLKLLDDF